MKPPYRTKVTAERVREVLLYAPETGFLGWRNRRAGQPPPGRHAGYIGADGYWKVRLDGLTYQAHRLIWLYMTGEWPSEEVDHINLNKADNRWGNLREASHRDNMINVRARKPSGSPSHLKGAYKSHRQDTWFSQIRINGRARRLGTFNTAEEAHAAYCEAAQRHHGVFARSE